MTFDVIRTLPKSIKDSKETAVKLGDLNSAFPVKRTLPKTIKDSKETSVKLGNLAPAFGVRLSR